MLSLTCTCTLIFSVNLANYGISRAKEWVSVNCGTSINTFDKNVVFRKSLLNFCQQKEKSESKNASAFRNIKQKFLLCVDGPGKRQKTTNSAPSVI